MADATQRPAVQTPKPQRDDLQRLIPDNVRLRRALEQLFTDVNQTLPDAIQSVGDSSQAVTEDVSMGVFGATDRRSARIETYLADLESGQQSEIRRLINRISDIEKLVSDRHDPVKVRVEKFITPTLLNSWVEFSAFNTTGYYKDPYGIVRIKGLVKDGVVGAATPIFTLPVGYRPSALVIIPAVGGSNTFARLNVAVNGDVSVEVGSNVFMSLDSISFRAA